MSTTPADLDRQLAAIREQLTEVRREAIELSRDYRRLPIGQLGVDTLGGPLTPGEALSNACDGLDGFIGALALADDAASIAQTYTTRLQ
ncbi:hypothetical protein [Williamsia muralis]|uniref:YbaB/EbfC DNA-binding family protein n=1 Tax=Williamsia marianensis TaxID=85044 RepID=A0ABU4F1N0_WILMA|nr:hypothetical protein [Williamsia muralis]MDV7136812.1 hypothetical protein [Williamsia muralis]